MSSYQWTPVTRLDSHSLSHIPACDYLNFASPSPKFCENICVYTHHPISCTRITLITLYQWNKYCVASLKFPEIRGPLENYRMSTLKGALQHPKMPTPWICQYVAHVICKTGTACTLSMSYRDMETKVTNGARSEIHSYGGKSRQMNQSSAPPPPLPRPGSASPIAMGRTVQS